MEQASSNQSEARDRGVEEDESLTRPRKVEEGTNGPQNREAYSINASSTMTMQAVTRSLSSDSAQTLSSFTALL